MWPRPSTCSAIRRAGAAGPGVLTISAAWALISDAAADVGLGAAGLHGADAGRFAQRAPPPQMSVANPVDTALFTDENYSLCAETVL